MLYIERNPETVEAFLYLEEQEPEWFIQTKERIVFLQFGREYIETVWGVSPLHRGEYVCRAPNGSSVWIESKVQFDQKYKPYVSENNI